MNAKWKRRLRAAALPLCSVVGVLAAFGVVLAWFPHTGDAWNLPLQEIDAPAHYYFIRKILREGLGAATRLWPNGDYYPPMFHLAAAAIIAVGRFLGIRVNVYGAFNLVWLVTSGLVWPSGVSLWMSYWTRQVDGETASHEARDSSSASWRPFSCCMMLIVPLLAVASASHPFLMLASGPLISFGLATTLLPYWLYVTLRLFDAIAARRHIVRWLVLIVLFGLLCVFAHPRIAFTWLLLMAPFILLRLPFKLILGALAAVVVCAVAFFFYMTGHYHSSRYLDPSSWFHTYVPNRTVPEALRVFITDNVSGPAGWFMAIVVVVSLVVAIGVVVLSVRSRLVVYAFDGRDDDGAADDDDNAGLGAGDGDGAGKTTDSGDGVDVGARAGVNDGEDIVAGVGDGVDTSASNTGEPSEAVSDGRQVFPRRASRLAAPPRGMDKDAISLMLAFLLVGLVYVCSTSLTGWFPNIVAAAWYRAETRPLSMIPFAIIPLLVFAACTIARLSGQQSRGDVSDKPVISATQPDKADKGDESVKVSEAIAVIVLAALAISCQFGNAAKETLGQDVAANVTLSGKPQNEQLTEAKYNVLQETFKTTGTDALIISDPLNGSMYGSAIFGANMLFPIYNAKHEKGGVIFSQTEAAFSSGQPSQLTATTCPVDGSVPKYFLAMGPQAPSLQMFTFRQQYDTFHRQDLIDGYVKAGALVKVKDFSSYGSYAKGWALYRIECAK
ncbi:hypothetical protein OZX73_08390 [Bifidobacterium sp. ESL0775]|uniref:DUF6541 family protein n=1 Tax=Bifidobacterium sp. ESL0775 TaxID=2983230 RepID=UPI0023F66BDB|nr:DUF6541 family protein [Bifidobacterium sp. ESL0775]WEV69260.1 hypothetical protein OZX73_08390 [Bifidobacterium sp. ESL0775]